MRACIMAAALLPVLVAGGEVSAAVVSVTETGTLSPFSYDSAGIFSSRGSNLSGDPFSLTITYDDDVGVNDEWVGEGGAPVASNGDGKAFTEALTIAGKTVSMGGLEGYISDFPAMLTYGVSGPMVGDDLLVIDGTSFWTSQPSWDFHKLSSLPSTGLLSLQYLLHGSLAESLSLVPDTTTVSSDGDDGPWVHCGWTPTPAVPESSTWALLILGVGLMGSALRRRTEYSVA